MIEIHLNVRLELRRGKGRGNQQADERTSRIRDPAMLPKMGIKRATKSGCEIILSSAYQLESYRPSRAKLFPEPDIATNSEMDWRIKSNVPREPGEAKITFEDWGLRYQQIVTRTHRDACQLHRSVLEQDGLDRCRSQRIAMRITICRTSHYRGRTEEREDRNQRARRHADTSKRSEKAPRTSKTQAQK